MSLTEDICSTIFGTRPVVIESVSPHVDRVRSEGMTAYVKRGVRESTLGKFSLEAWAYRCCREVGVLVPDVLGASEPGADVDFIVTAALDGGNQWERTLDVRAGVLRTAGEQLRRIHEIAMDGAGPVVGDPPRGIFDDWCPFVRGACDDAIPLLVDVGVLEQREADAMLGSFQGGAEILHRPGPAKLLHGDFECGHIYSDGERYTGIIDFGQMQAGDPVFDLGRFTWWDSDHLDDLLDGYGRDAITDEDTEVRMPCYRVAKALVIMALCVRIGEMDKSRVRWFVDMARWWEMP